MSAGDPTKPGTYYARDPASGRLLERGPRLAPGERADVWICRRVADYPFLRPPSSAAIDRCGRCGVLIAYNPARACTAPRVCMQCAGIAPLPFGD